MINLKIRMVGGEEFIIRNFFAEDVNTFIRGVFLKNQTELNWYEVIPGTFIKVNQIESVAQLSDQEIEDRNSVAVNGDDGELKDGEEIVLPENKQNEDLEKNQDTPEPSEE